MTEAAGASQAKARARWRDAIWRDPALLPAEAVVGLAMEAYAGRDTGLLWPSFATVGATLCLHPDTARKAVAKLARLGWLSLARRTTGPGAPNVYALGYVRVEAIERLREHLKESEAPEQLATTCPTIRRENHRRLVDSWLAEKGGRPDPAFPPKGRAPAPGLSEKGRAPASKRPGVRAQKAGRVDPTNLPYRTFLKEPSLASARVRDHARQPDLLGNEASEAAPKVDTLAAEFDVWWEAVPIKDDKGDARQAYRAARKIATAEQLLTGIRRYAAKRAAEIAAGDPPQFTKAPYRWLKAEAWLNETTTPRASPAPAGSAAPRAPAREPITSRARLERIAAAAEAEERRLKK